LQSATLSLENIRQDFPIMQRKVRDNKSLVYLDNASTTQKPIQVIDAINDYYKNHNANIHRAVYALAEEATEAYENTRDKVAKFLNVSNRQEIIFVRGTTEAINLVAYAWGRPHIKEGDIIVTTEYEHHSNIVPWQLLTQEKGAKLEYIGMDDNGELILGDLDKYLKTGKVKLVTFSQMSNVLGTISNTDEIIRRCKKAGVKVLIDGAQSVPHMKVDLGNLDCDFFAFSAHKMLGPTGVGVLWVKKEVLENLREIQVKITDLNSRILASKDVLERTSIYAIPRGNFYNNANFRFDSNGSHIKTNRESNRNRCIGVFEIETRNSCKIHGIA